MALLFDRVYRLEVGNEGETLTVDGGVGQRDGLYGEVATTPSGEPARIQFRVVQGMDGYVARAQVSVYGLSRETRQKAYERFETLTLTAGFRDNYGQIFSGHIYNAEIMRDGPENIITFYCRAAGRSWTDAFVSKTFGAGTSMQEVIRGVAETYGVPVEMVGDFSNLPTLISSLPVAMGTTRFLNMSARNFDFNMVFEPNKVVLYRADSQRDIVHSTSALTGMVGTPIIRERGIDVTTKMNTEIRLKETLEVTNITGQLAYNKPDAINYPDSIGEGRYKIIAFAHIGDLYGDQWDTQIEGLNTRVPESPAGA